MIARFLCVAALAVCLLGCEKERFDERRNNQTDETEDVGTARTVQDPNLNDSNQDVDNTGRNIRDRNSNYQTPVNQLENDADRTITQDIRKALISDNSLSMNAKNIKIITRHGVVTLRGVVNSNQEKDTIALKAQRIRGIQQVDNQLEVKQSY